MEFFFDVNAVETQSIEKQLFLASSRGKYDLVQSILASHSESIDCSKLVNGMNALHIAVKKKFADVSKFLIENCPGIIGLFYLFTKN